MKRDACNEVGVSNTKNKVVTRQNAVLQDYTFVPANFQGIRTLISSENTDVGPITIEIATIDKKWIITTISARSRVLTDHHAIL